MSDTPRTDAAIKEANGIAALLAPFARTLERELAQSKQNEKCCCKSAIAAMGAMQEERDQLKAEVERLTKENHKARKLLVTRVEASQVDEAYKHRDQWRAVAEQAISLLGANHTSSCSIQDAEEPRCDCGYQQHYEQALARFNAMEKNP